MSDHGGELNGKVSEMSLTLSREKRWKFPIDDSLAPRREVTVLNVFDSEYYGTVSFDTARYHPPQQLTASDLGKRIEAATIQNILTMVQEKNKIFLEKVINFWTAYTCSLLQIIDHTVDKGPSYNYGLEKLTNLENWIFARRLEDWVWKQMLFLHTKGHLNIADNVIKIVFQDAGVTAFNRIDINNYTGLQEQLIRWISNEADRKKILFLKRCLIKAAFLEEKRIVVVGRRKIHDWLLKALASMDNVVIKIIVIKGHTATSFSGTGNGEVVPVDSHFFELQFQPVTAEVLLSSSSEDYFQPAGLRNQLILGNINGEWKTISWKDFLWLAVVEPQNPDERLPDWISRLLEKARTFAPDWKKGLWVKQTPTSNTLICLLKTMLEKSRKKSIKFNRSIIDQHSKDLYFDYVIESAKRVWYAVAVKFCNCLQLGPKQVNAERTWDIEWKGKHFPNRPRLDNLIVDFVPNALSGKPRQRVTDNHWTKFVRALYSQNISYFISEFQKEMLKKMDGEDRGENWGSDVRSNGLFCFWFNEQDVFRCLDYLERQKNPQNDDGIPSFEPEIEDVGNTEFAQEHRRVTALLNSEVEEAATDASDDIEPAEPTVDLDDKSETGSSKQSKGDTEEHETSDLSSNASDHTDKVKKRKAPLPDILDRESKNFVRSFERFCRMMDAEVKKIGGKSSYPARDRDVCEEYMRRGACTWWRLIHAYSSQDEEPTGLQIKDSEEKLEQARVTVGYLEGDWDDKAQKFNFKGISGIRKAMADWREWRSHVLDDGKRWKYMAYGSGMSAPGVTAVETFENTRENTRSARENEYLVGRRGGL